MSMLISLYGLLFNPRGVEQQVRWLHDILPPSAYWLIADRLHDLVIQPRGRLGIGLAIGLLLTFWSAALGMRSVLSALTVAYGGRPRRRFLRSLTVSLTMTLVAVLGSVLAMVVLVGMPAMFDFVHPWAWRLRVIHFASIAALLGFAGLSVALLYRFGAAPPRPPRPWISPGAALALTLWLVASAPLTFYIVHIATFGVTYGPLGAVVTVMLWFFVTAYAVLLSAELNAQLERLSAETTADPTALVPQAI